MALPAFDATKHHIGLGVDAENLKGFTLNGGYLKDMRRPSEQVADGAMGPVEVGGAADQIGPRRNFSRWTQDDFSGGAYQYEWGRDEAMFAESRNMIPSQQSRALVTAPPLYFKKDFNPADEDFAPAQPILPKSMFMVAGSIYVAFAHGILRYQIGTDVLTWGNLYVTADSTIVSADYDSNDQKIVVLYDSRFAGDRPFVARWKTDLTAPAFSPTFTGPTGSEGYYARGMAIRDQNYVVSLNQHVWIGDPPEKPDSVNAEVTWTKIGRLPGRWVDSVAYNGMTYILVNDGSFRSQIIAFDGTALMPICSFPFSFYAKTIVEYGGRIFVGGTGTDVNGGEHYAELYEVTGASVRLVRSFSPETAREGVTWPKVITDLAVFEGMLWFSQKGVKLVTYDLTTDGFFGGPQFQQDEESEIYKWTTGRGRLWGWLHHDSNELADGIYRIAQPADPISAYDGELVTSDFAFEPAVDKRWDQIHIRTKYKPCTGFDWSTDGGETWTQILTTVTNEGAIYQCSANLQGIPASKQIRFKLYIPCGTDSTTFAELLAITTGFSFESPTPVNEVFKHVWMVTVNGAEEVERRDDDVEVQDVTSIATQLWSWAENQTTLVFRDVNGDTKTVKVMAMSENQPIIGPNATAHSRPEAFFSLQLLEQ